MIAAASPGPPHPMVALDVRSVAEVAVAVWRLSRRAGAAGEGVHRHVRAVTEALADAGVQARSYCGAAFDAGLALRVIAFQPTPGLTREEVMETIRPSVYVRGSLVMLGEVIVGIPADGTATTEEKGGTDEQDDD